MMASVLFSTIGQAVGGPLGAGIGLAVGAGVDSALLRGVGRGARDGYAQASAYGEPVPLLFGTNRVAGQVIWALPPADSSSRKGSGRQAKTASLAVALCRGRIREVRRIWADGRLFRDPNGEFEVPVQMRVHAGDGAAPDPLVVAAEGPDAAPAFLSLAYVVFEDLPLEPFGNRIPSFSFEVVADGDDPASWLGRLAGEAGIAGTAGATPMQAQGFAAFALPAEEDLSVLAEVADAHPAIEDGMVRLGGDGKAFTLADAGWLAPGDPEPEGPQRWAGQRPATAEIGYLDVAREYQLGQQRTRGGRAGRALRFSWQLSATAQEALRLSARVLRTAEARADRLSCSLPLRWLEMTVGDRIALATGEHWRVVGREVLGAAVQIEAERMAPAVAVLERSADAGRAAPAVLERVPPTVLTAIEPAVPLVGTAPTLLLIGSGAQGWRGAELGLLEGGEVRPVGRMLPDAASGWLLEPLGPGPETVWDEHNRLIVQMERGVFLTRTPLEVLAGGGMVHAGGELLQYRQADVLSEDVVQLRGLLRRRRATGMAGVSHPAGARVVMVGAGALGLDTAADAIGGTLLLLAAGRGDPPGGTAFEVGLTGAGHAPLAPVHLRGRRLSGGAIACRWVPRSRGAWGWQEAGAPQPVTGQWWLFRRPDGSAQRMEVVGEELLLSAEQQIARFGGLLEDGSFAIELVGEGPVQMRRSGWAEIRG
jgi:hypothetical protein